MRVIALILGWHLVALGANTVVLGFLCHSTPGLVIGTGALLAGVVLWGKYRNACARCGIEPADLKRGNAALDYY